MTDSIQHVWVIPDDFTDLAPLPALKLGENLFAAYDRREKRFGDFYEHLFHTPYPSFEECRAAMIDERIEALDETREHARKLANSIEHIRTIPTAPFPDVVREVSEAQQQEAQQQENEGQEEVKGQEVKPAAKPLLKRPSRKSNG